MKKSSFIAVSATLAILLFSIFSPSVIAQDVDTQPPADVSNVTATPGDAKITLNWYVATDNVGTVGYKLYYGTTSVTNDGGVYPFGPIDVGNVIIHEVTSLINDQPYYFALTAYDAAGNESEFYSVEATATPGVMHSAPADTESPKVSKVETVDKVTVKVTFSEPVVLPEIDPEKAFTIEDNANATLLEVIEVEMDEDDETEKTVILTTGIQQAGASYVLTAGIDIQDLAENPIVSGTSDTGEFTGTDIEPVVKSSAEVAEGEFDEGITDTEVDSGPELVAVSVTDSTHLEVTFSEPVKLNENGTENFIITEVDSPETLLEVTTVALNQNRTKATLTTAEQKAISYNLIVIDVANDEDNFISLENNATRFEGVAATVAPEPEDTTPPEDAEDFVGKMIKDLIVTLSWKGSLDSAGDLANYVLYMTTNPADYGDDGILVSPDVENFDMTNGVPGTKYFFKLTAEDEVGNESTGVYTDFVLPETGPEIGLIALVSLGLGKLWKKKKKLLKK